MKFNKNKAGPLLTWMNSVFPENQIWEFGHMRDGFRLLEICFKLKGREDVEAYKTLSLYNKLEIIFNDLHDDFHLTDRQRFLILGKISEGLDLELQLAKVALLLCYCSFKKTNPVALNSRTESDITFMFRFVRDDASGLCLDEGLDQFLDQDSVMNLANSSSGSSCSSPFYIDEESPMFGRFQRPPRVQFQELCTVASSSDSSPMQDLMSTPHFQLKKLRKELAHEGDVRDELEKELADHISIISEKEGLISQLQHRVERMLREQGELEKDHKAALLELQEKNESLLHRVHEVLKQCQDLKTDNSQKEKKIDELTEENGTLSAQLRNVFSQLARAEQEVAKLTVVHESAQTEWKNRKELLEKELNEAVTHKECLSEQVLILQGKISVLEDELKKAQSQERGEVLGPIMEWEKLKQELADLTLQLAQLQESISHLEKKKAEVEALLAEERCSFEKETARLQLVVFDLEKSINSIRLERETLQEALKTQKEMLSAQISALERDVSRLQQVEVQLTAEIKISADLRQQREELEGKVASLDRMVHSLHAEIQGLEVERASQQDAINSLISDLQIARATVQEYEKKLEEHQKVVAENNSLKNEACTMQQELNNHLKAIGDLQAEVNELRFEKTEEENKVSEALVKIESLQTEILHLCEKISLKDEEIRNLTKEYESVDNELKLVKEQNVEINAMIKSNRKEHEETVEKLQQELHCAASAASEKQEQMLVLSAEVTSLKEQICRYSENEAQKQQELSILEAQHNVLKENLTSLQNQLAEATTSASQKESEFILLQQELSHQETLREQTQELEKIKREELEGIVSELQAKIIEVSSIASEREACVSSLQYEMKDQLSKAKQCEADLRNEMKEKVGNLQELLDAANHGIAEKEHHLESLNQSLKQMELLYCQKEEEIIASQQAKQQLENNIAEQKQQLDEIQQNREILRNERDHLSTRVSSLQEEIHRSQQDFSDLQTDHNVLKEKLVNLQDQVEQAMITASQKESELLLLQQELSHQETLREKALELEAIKREEFEKKVKELQDRILEVSTLASQREAQVISLENEMRDQQLSANQSKDNLCREWQEKLGILKGELDVVSRDAADKDHQLESLDQKLKEMEMVVLQKEKDVMETHQAKEDLEKRIAELEECKQKLEIMRNERDHLSTEVASLKEEIHSYQDTQMQKQQTISVLEVENNALKENMAALEKQLAEEITTASQKNSELQNKLHQQESLHEKAQELEIGRHEEFERRVRELQAKVQEVSTLASEKEAVAYSLQEELTGHLKAKVSEDDLRRVLEEKVETLQREIETASCDATSKDGLLQTLDQKLRQMEMLCQQKEDAVFEIQNSKEDLQKEMNELVSKNQELEGCLQHLEMVKKEKDLLSNEVTSLKEQINDQSLRAKQSEADLCIVFEEKIETLQGQLESSSCDVSDKEKHLQTLHQKVSQMDLLCQQKENAVLEMQNAKEDLQKKIDELVSEKQQLEGCLQNLEMVKSERDLLSTEVTSLKDQLNDQDLKAKQSEDDLRKVLEEKIKNLQGQLETASRDVSEKDQLLQTLDQKVTQMDQLCKQKEKYALDLLQVKENLEKRIGEITVEKQQLEGCQQNLETVSKDKDNLLNELTFLKVEIQSYQEKEVQMKHELSVLENEHNILQENLDTLQKQVVELTASASQKESELQNEVCKQEKLQEKAQKLEKDAGDLQAKILEISTLASEREAQISSLKDEINSQHLKAKQSEDDLLRVFEEKIENLQGQLEIARLDVSDKDQLLQTLNQKLKQMEELCKQKETCVLEMHQTKEDLEKKTVELQADKSQQNQQNLEMLRQEKDHLKSLNQTIRRECEASRKIRAELELNVEEQTASILALKKASQQWEEQNQELLEQLKAKTEAVEHYKAQVEKAMNHYNGKKQLLLEAQELNKTLEQSLEVSKREAKALETELTLARMELNQANDKEKSLAAKVKTLEAQVDFADRQLREKRRIADDGEDLRQKENLYFRVPEKQQDTSADSLEFELNDSLNTTCRSAVPGESSTPLVRSSERLAAKRRALGAESLETLYFTPMGKQGYKRKVDHNDGFERKLESSITSIGDLVVDSAKKLTASARRRRTTQVINITLAKKAQGSSESEESFSSLHSARSHPNLAVHQSRPISIDFSEDGPATTLSKADTLQNLPGYRRSTVHSVGPPRATSTFCIGAENEPEHAADDWMRIAELQSRNKACLPHLKSSYPLESRPSLGPSFTVTDEDLRLGDPSETIRRASMMPGQILESLNSRRFSLAPETSSSQAPARSHPQRATMLPCQIQSSTAAHRASQLTKTSSRSHTSENKRSPLAPKRPASQLQGPDTPEAKKLASCFPRPMTPKGRFGNSQNRPPVSPAERRQSVMFTVVNTPKNSARGDSRLQRGLNKLRNSTRKSPAVASRALRSAVSGKSPLDVTLRKSPRNKSPKTSNAKKETQ
nr:nuclear mitotic apparatus protein 1 isoform X1 [Danio rerio]XP_009290242.1 nuclear mitotic apparatus protein 1 isoform X1 [Danio rerio]|eukprot:XP_009290241.1 nuclear mitotic apparatus protein 1 isoform X1 [Danio rerio]